MPYYTGAGSFSGFEYTMVPDGGPATPEDAVFSHGSNPPYTWAQIEIECPEQTIVKDHYVEVRYFELEITEIPPPTDPETGEPIGEPTYNSVITYPAWNLNDQTMTKPRMYFERELGDEMNMFVDEPGAYGTARAGIRNIIQGAPRPPFPALDPDDPEYTLIPDDNAYSYCRIFDQADIEWYPRLSPASQPPLNGKNAIVPSEPYDPDRVPPVFPFDAILGFVPDPRDVVTITFTMNTETDKGNESITIYHPVSQKSIDVGEKMRLFMDKSYYGNNYTHIGLYPPDTPPAYDSRGRNLFKEETNSPQPHRSPDGRIRYRVRNEPLSMTQLTRRTYPYDEDAEDWRPYPEEQCRP